MASYVRAYGKVMNSNRRKDESASGIGGTITMTDSNGKVISSRPIKTTRISKKEFDVVTGGGKFGREKARIKRQ